MGHTDIIKDERPTGREALMRGEVGGAPGAASPPPHGKQARQASIKKQMSCLAAPLQKDVMTACGPRARGGAAPSHRPREMDDTDGGGTHTSCLNMNNRFVSV